MEQCDIFELTVVHIVRWEDESYGKQNMLLDYIIIGVGQENKSPRPHFDPNKLPSRTVPRSGNSGGGGQVVKRWE